MESTILLNFEKNLPPQNIAPHLMFIIWNFIAIFEVEYSLIGIVKPKFSRGMKYDAEF